MSHFTVLVTKTQLKSVEDQLAPYDENLETPRYVEYTKQQLIDKGRAEIEKYKNGNYAKYLEDPKGYEASCSNPPHMKYIKTEFPKQLEWSDDEVYQEQTKWYEEEDIGDKGEVYSEWNTNSKWDWYKVGGRWAGFFQVKSGATGQRGEDGIMDSHVSEGGVDVVKVKDIDWEAMGKVIREGRAKGYDEEVSKPENDRFSWEDDTDAKRFVKMSKEEYVNQPVHHSTFAVVHDGQWYERGEMGWWAIVKDEKEQGKWDEEFSKLVKSLDPNDEVTVVDCHI